MKNIGLVTSLYNYGSMLQCFSTIKYINSLGFKCNYLEYAKNKSCVNKVNFNFFKVFNNKSILEDYMKDRIFQNFKKDFILNYIKPINLTYKNLQELDNETSYKLFIAGGDQIWNSSNVFDLNDDYRRCLFLQFASKTPTASFCTSFGASEVYKKNERIVKEYLKKINTISIREEFGKNIINKYSNKKVNVFSDPVVLFSKNEWINIYKNKTKLKNKNYVLLHYLNTPSDLSISHIKSFIKSNKKTTLLSFYGYQKHFKDIKGIKYIKGSPFDYLYLINHANMVFTDSFHTSIFSIIFNKPFAIFNRSDYVSKQVGRIQDLMNKYNCKFNYIVDDSPIKYSKLNNYIKVGNKQLEKYRKLERDYLYKILK